MTENQSAPQTGYDPAKAGEDFSSINRILRQIQETSRRTVRWTDLIDDPEERKRLGLR